MRRNYITRCVTIFCLRNGHKKLIPRPHLPCEGVGQDVLWGLHRLPGFEEPLSRKGVLGQNGVKERIEQCPLWDSHDTLP